MKHFLHTALLAVLLCLVSWSWAVVAGKDAGTLASYNFPDHVLLSSTSAASRSVDTTSPLTLVAAGLRRKKILVVEVDVYHVGLYLSHQMMNSFEQTPLTQASDLVNRLLPTRNDETVSIVLRFARQVPTSKVVDAIVESLRSYTPSTTTTTSTSTSSSSEDYSSSVNTLSSLLVSAIGPKGMEADEELSFAFYPDVEEGGVQHQQAIQVSVRRSVAGVVVHAPHVLLTRRLLEIYTHAENAVAPQVPRFLLTRFLRAKEL